MDPRKVNGAVLLGLNGVVIKSHGSTDAVGFAAAIDMGHDMMADGILDKIGADLRYFGQLRAPENAGAAA
jgi:glycerol-3-phosphate acyltransferase PlsX